MRLLRRLRWRLRQRLARPARFYGREGTIHQTTVVDVEVHGGRIVAVWFRCQPLAFRQADVESQRTSEMQQMYETASPPQLVGVEVVEA